MGVVNKMMAPFISGSTKNPTTAGTTEKIFEEKDSSAQAFEWTKHLQRSIIAVWERAHASGRVYNFATSATPYER